MQGRAKGQSLVEMAFVAPILLILLFGIIDMGYLMFAFATVSQAARDGAETASQLPPFPDWLEYKDNPPSDAAFPGYAKDDCVFTILEAVKSNAVLFSDQANDISRYVIISYPEGNDTRNMQDRGPIEVRIDYPVRGLTPVFGLLGFNEGFTMSVVARRSLENLGVSPSSPDGKACAENPQDWQDKHPDL
ncbi:pilus assembly protein [Candidatus Gracilibacteria bacterium]|nr:pilus assembly protein [Candidatus Gracilibacteria bacterium]